MGHPPNGLGLSGWAAGTGNTIGLQGGASSTAGQAINATETATSGNTVGMLARIYSPAGIGALILNSATGPITGALISARTNAGVQFTVGGTGNINTLGSYTGAGTITGTRLISTVATGTAPLQVASTTLVPNLNASLLGGNTASAFALASGSPGYIWNGTALQTANFNISGVGSGNSFNSATSYQIGGSNVVSIGSARDSNLFLGVGAGANNVSGSAENNLFSGFSAGLSNTTGGGNTFSGALAGYKNTTGGGNTFTGGSAGYSNTIGFGNTFSGSFAGIANITGINNTFYGASAGVNNTTGSSNIYIGNWGPVSGDESATIRIGSPGVGNYDQTAAFIAGISGAATNSGVPVFIDATGKLGTTGGSLGSLVTSFNGRTGAVVPAANDYGFSLLSGALGSSQLSGTYANALTLNNVSNSFTGSFTGNGAGLTGVLPSSGSPYYIQNGTAVQTGANFNIDGSGKVGSLAVSSLNLSVVNGSITYGLYGQGNLITAGGNQNVLVGPLAGNSSVLAAAYGNNTAAGSSALHSQTAQGLGANTAIGAHAMEYNTVGDSNTATGYTALNQNIDGQYNVAVGSGALCVNTSGHDNTAIGAYAGSGFACGQNGGNITGSWNTYIGEQAGPGAPDLIFATAIGFGARVSRSNSIILGQPGQYIGIGTNAPTYTLEVDGASSVLFNNTTGGNIVVGQNQGTNQFRVDGTGKGFFNGGTQTGGADFAESVAVHGSRSQYEPGDVLVIDPEADRHLALSQGAYSTLVAGIYSTKPGVLATPHTMDAPEISSEVPLAIVGIVPCKVTAENGAIARGDLLVTSSQPGYAMRGSDRRRMLGAVVGKALEPLATGMGVIQVLVTLQ